MSRLILVLAGIFEVGWAIGLRFTDRRIIVLKSAAPVYLGISQWNLKK